ncbi:MAG: T9SS type A sorting domain-containing protein [Candidatus Cloacimonetes bacterium]|nr:T9SS type A sorting domain-containing protein [Candidatus Cloacimonadota bacterium]
MFLALLVQLSADPVVVSGGTANDYESWIARLNDSRLLVIFARNPDWQSGDIYQTYSADDGLSWSQPQPVIAENGDQATLSFVQQLNGELRLWYASNQNGGYRIFTAYSPDGWNWIVEGEIDLGWDQNDQFYDPNVIMEDDGSFTMSYVKMGGGAYVAHKPFAGEWDQDMTLVAPGAYRARIATLLDGGYVVAYHKRTGSTYEYDVFIQTGCDLSDWNDPVQISDNHNSHDPFILGNYQGDYVIMYAKYQYPAYNIVSRRSEDLIVWGDEEFLTQDNDNNTQPHFFFENEQIYLIWAHAVYYPIDHDVYFELYDTATASLQKTIEPHSMFEISPNPCKTYLDIRLSENMRSDFTLDVFDLKGRRIMTRRGMNNSGYELSLDLSRQSRGIYFIRMKSLLGNEIKKFNIY